ncbi:MAG: hypothetical protein DRG24_01825 [Epsilonproteobacteria bacterium]|nr:MAG: hypothetical protein DRG24_01825 [Campylobacterota bacterium]
MFKNILLLSILSGTLLASLMDFRTLDQATQSYKKGDFEAAQKQYESVGTKSDALYFNLGDSYYKQKKYKEALLEYEKISSETLRAKALHNIGNSYANLKQLDKAIESYEEALNLQDDEDTKYNLELMKKQKQKDQQKQDQKKKQDQNKDQKNKDQKNKKDQQNKKQKDKQEQNKDQQNKDQQKSDAQKSKEDQKKKEGQKKAQAEKKKQEEKEQQEQMKQTQSEVDEAKKKQEEEEKKMQAMQKKPQPISDMQERKYQNMLNGRGIKTLMVPLKSKGENRDEQQPW